MRHGCWLGAIGLVLLLAPAVAAQAPIPLDSRSPVDQAIAPGQTYAASLVLREGESADIVVLQQGIDLVVDLLGPDGRLIDSVDSPNGRQGEEPLTVAAAATGLYQIRIRPISAEEPAGRFTLRVAAFRDRAATARLAAERRNARRQASDWLNRDSALLPATGLLAPDAALAPFDRLAGEARIVGLGEASHGSRELNDLRLSLVRRLVERHGYRLIAIEGSASRWRALEPYLGGGSAVAPPDTGGIWIGRRIMADLLGWARQWNLAHPQDRVRIVGVDPQDNEPARLRFDAFLARAYGPQFAAAWAPASAELAAADEQTLVFGNSDVSAPVRQQVLEAHARIVNDAAWLAERFGEEAARDALATARELLQFADFNGGLVAPARSRDWYMAVNLLAAMRDAAAPPKTVYWAHNAHVSAAPTSWGPTGALLRQAVGCAYRAVAATFGRGDFLAQLPGDPDHRLLVSTLAEAGEETIENVLAGTGAGARFAAWRCGGEAPPPAWLREPRPLRWIGGLFAPDTLAGATYRPYLLTEAFDGIAYFPAVAAEETPAERPLVPPRPRQPPPPPAQ